MSGYLEVKYPSKSNLGLNPFKSWKRQWCILRPSPTCSGGSLAVYCSEAGASAGTVDLPPGCIVRRTKSRTRPYAFAVFSIEEPRKPRVLLAGQSLHDAQIWMEKIKALLNNNKVLGNEATLKDSYSVTVTPTELSRKCRLNGADGVVTVSTDGILVSRTLKLAMFVQWRHVTDVQVVTHTDKSSACVITVHSENPNGGGELKLSTPMARELAAALCDALRPGRSATAKSLKKLSKSEGDLRANKCSDEGEARRSSWHGDPPEVSVDDSELVVSKERGRIPSGPLARCSGAGDLAPSAAPSPLAQHPAATPDDSMSDRWSVVSVASGIYEEIEEGGGGGAGAPLPAEEPAYESVAECVYATMRRVGKKPPPPPLPPRLPFGTMKLGESWNSRVNEPATDGVTRHSSLGSLPRCYTSSAGSDPHSKTKTLPKMDKRQPFSVFRKRLKSDSRIATSPKSETKENKDVETKKKRFDFTPTRDIFKNFRVSRKMKNLKIAPGSLAKVGETKSCEFLDDTEHVSANRCSKSVECLEADQFLDETDDLDLSIEFNDDAVAALALPQEIVDLILRGRQQMNKVRLKDVQVAECHYMPMSPILPPAPIEHHYMVMSPRTNLA